MNLMTSPRRSIDSRRESLVLRAVTLVLFGFGFCIAASLAADPPHVLPKGTVPNDTRLGPLKGEHGDFQLNPAKSPEQWQSRADEVRRSMLIALGLWPMPTKTPLNAVIHGRIEQDDYTVERVYFESLPSFFVTGNLYRPKEKTGRLPGVLSPHGHFPGGRFQDIGLDAVRWEIARGAERFDEGGRSWMQSRCVQLARMGCVVFHYDMIGYGDSTQLPLELVHRFSRERAMHDRPPDSGFYSAAAESRLQNVMGLHTYNSIRALDFLTSLPDVDPERIAVTGGSGGGTQTFMLCAVDDRPLVSVPVVIVSTTRQGGCTCENICGLRIGSNNLEFTALHAPKPLLLISADDATRTMPERGFPELKQHYRALGAEHNVEHSALLHFPHNYNYVSRTAMYHFVNKHLKLGLDEPILERPYKLLVRDELTVWSDDHPRPPGGPESERRLLKWLADDADRQLAELIPHDRESMEQYREVVGEAWRVLLRPELSNAKTVTFDIKNAEKSSGHVGRYGMLRYRTIEGHNAALPLVLLTPNGMWRRVVVWLDGAGKAALFSDGSEPQPHIQRLLDSGVAVVGVDLLYQGEFLTDGKPPTRQRWLDGEPSHAGWTYCYNLPLFARRVHDIMAVVQYVRQLRGGDRRVSIVGLNGMAPGVAAAVVHARGKIESAAINTRGFRFADLNDVFDASFVPGAVKYGDLPALLALCKPTKLLLTGETDGVPPIVETAYSSTGHRKNLKFMRDTGDAPEMSIVDWLLDD